MADWFNNGGGFFTKLLGLNWLKRIFSQLGDQVKGVYKTVLDATMNAFNDDAARDDFDIKQTIEVDARKYRNPVTLQTWVKKQLAIRAYKGLLIQGQLYSFSYPNPLTKDKLEYYDANPLVLSFGIYYAKTGNIVEYAVNLHYLPQSVREAFLIDIFNAYRKQYKKQMYSRRPRSINEFSWAALQGFVQKYGIDFAVRSYIPDRRRNTILIRYEDWGKGVCIPSSQFVGISDKELQKLYAMHLAEQKNK